MQGPTSPVGEAGIGDGGVQTLAEAMLAEAAAAFTEHEVGQVPSRGWGSER